MTLQDCPRFVTHQGKLYDVTKKFDANCVKMHAQRIHSLHRSVAAVHQSAKIKANRHARRAKASGKLEG